MNKKVSAQRTLLLSITLTGDMTRDLIALESYGFENIPVMSVQKRDMLTMSHEPMVFYTGPKGTYSHSLSEDNVLSIWQETIAVED